jgi:phosphate transport system protein
MAAVTDRHIEVIKSDVLRMMGGVGLSIEEAVRSLDDRDAATARRAVARGRQISEYQRRLEAECLVLLARKLEGKDLRLTACTYKMAGDLEQIGEYCTAIAEVTLAVIDKPFSTGDFPAMGRTALEMLNICMEAYKWGRMLHIEEVFEKDRRIDQFYQDTFIDAIRQGQQEPGASSTTIFLVEACRALERIGYYLTDIAERIIFIENGVIYEGSEPLQVPGEGPG